MRSTSIIRAESAAIVVLLLFSGSALAQAERSRTAGSALHKLVAAEWDYEMEQHPSWASSLGDRRWNDRWEDLRMEAIVTRHNRHRQVLTELSHIDRSRSAMN